MKVMHTDRDFPDVSGGLIFGAAALIAPWAIAYGLGLDQALAELIDSFGRLRLVALALLYGASFVIIGSVLRGLFLLLGLGAFGGNLLTERLAAGLAGLLRHIGGICAGLASMIVLALRAVIRPLEVRCHEWITRLREERDLWQRYRDEFYQAYGSYAEFKRAFYGDDGHHDDHHHDRQHDQREERHGISLDDAFALLGLSVTCRREEFEARYRDLMKQVHPDRAGPNGMATQLNEARALIRKQKGWK